MSEIFSRNEMFWGEKNQDILKNSDVAVFGLGGVGGFCAEMLARAGVGSLCIIDFDRVSESNINRQIVALNSTVGQFKTELFEKRLLDINPDINLKVVTDFYTKEFNFEGVDCVCDAIDTMRSKVQLLVDCYDKKIPVISCFGAGNRFNPEELYSCDISKIRNKKTTFVQNILYQLKKHDIVEGIEVVLSDEKPLKPEKIVSEEKITTKNGENIEFNKITPASTPFVASTAGIMMAAMAVKKLIGT